MSSSRRKRSYREAPAFTILSLRSWSPQLWMLALFLVVVFLTGGSSRADVGKLVVLRPLAVVMCGLALATLRREHLSRYWPVWAMFGAVALLTITHLVPLPPAIWQSLPGRGILVEIDALAGMDGMWRPLSMYPEGTWNALYALSVPLAVLLLAAQLEEADRFRLLVVLVALSMLSGLLGVVQSAGTDIRFYQISSETAGLFANRNHQAALLACLFPMLAALAICAGRFSRDPRAVRLIAGAGIVALAPLIVVTGSRMGLIVGAIAFLSLVFMPLGGKHKRRGFASSTLLQLAVAALMAAGMVLGTIFLARDRAFDRVSGLDSDARFPVWQGIWDFLPDYLPWGSGIGSFAPVYQIHEPTRLLAPQYFNQAHNDWLDLVLTAGLPGVLLAVIAGALFALAVQSAIRAQGISGTLRRAGLIMILVLAFASISDYPVRTPILSAVLAIAAIWARSPFSQSTVKESNTRHA